MTWGDIKILSREKLILLTGEYSNYVMDAIDRGVEPVCVAEYYDNEFRIVDLRYSVIELIISDKCYTTVIREAVDKYVSDWDEDTLERFLGLEDE